MISAAQIKTYVETLIPTPETNLRPREIPANVQTFDPLGQGRGGWTVMSVFDKTADLINKICTHIQYATDLRQQEFEEERRWFEIEGSEEPSEETLEHLDLAYDAARKMREQINDKQYTASENAFQWAKQVILHRNPWEALEFGLSEMAKSVSCSDGLVVLFEDAERVRKVAEGRIYTNIRSNMADMAKRVLEAVEREMDAEKDETGKRPADVYRRWAKVLRWIVRYELAPRASRVLRELSLEQSLPVAELDSPEWLDAYTGEVDMAITDRVTIKMPTADKDDLEVAALSVSESFNDDDDLEQALYHADMSTEAAEWDVREPTWMEIQNDLKPSSDQEILRENAAIKRFRRAMNREYNKLAKKGLDREASVEMLRHILRAPIKIMDHNTGEIIAGANSEVDLLINELNKLAEAYETKDIAFIFLGLQNEFGLEEEDSFRIHLTGSPNNLLDWLELFGDEVMESLHSTYEPRLYTVREDLEEAAEEDAQEASEPLPFMITDGEDAKVSYFSEESIRKIVAQAAKDIEGKVKPSVYHHPAFIDGFLRAMSAGTSTSYKDTDGVWRSAGQKAGWEAWMEQFNPSAFKAYQQARRDGLDFNKAKAVFWSMTKATKKTDTIVGLIQSPEKVPCGLKLGSGRTITWSILALKLKGGELIVTDEQRAKLKALLPGIGQQAVAARL